MKPPKLPTSKTKLQEWWLVGWSFVSTIYSLRSGVLLPTSRLACLHLQELNLSSALHLIKYSCLDSRTLDFLPAIEVIGFPVTRSSLALPRHREHSLEYFLNWFWTHFLISLLILSGTRFANDMQFKILATMWLGHMFIAPSPLERYLRRYLIFNLAFAAFPGEARTLAV